MPLCLGQIVYTSFPGVGFTSLCSPDIPNEIHQVFLKQIVYLHWDSYNPPGPTYRAVYLYQHTLEDTLFGWLYSYEMDDLGRSHIPYFICYYLAGPLQTSQLGNILNCLVRGPVELGHRQNFPTTLGAITIPDRCNYQPAESGVSIALDIQKDSYIALKEGRLVNLFIPYHMLEKEIERDRQTYLQPPKVSKHLNNVQKLLESRHLGQKTMNTDEIESILQELVSKPIGIQGAVVVSSEGQPVAAPIGMDYNSALLLAGAMLYVAKSTCEEFNWPSIDTIAIRGQEGHVILNSCGQGNCLLVKAKGTVAGLLEGEAIRTAKKLQAKLDTTETSAPPQQNARSPEANTEITYRGFKPKS